MACCRSDSRDSSNQGSDSQSGRTYSELDSAVSSTASWFSARNSSLARGLEVNESPELMPGQRRGSTMASMKAGRTAGGSRFRLASRADEQAAVVWMEGQENIAIDSKDEWSPRSLDESEEQGESRCPKLETRHSLPAGLISSLTIGAASVFTLQASLVHQWFGTANFGRFIQCSGALYVLTFGLMAYTTLADAGQLDEVSTFHVKMKWPLRSHKSWQYTRPIRRYDHYCRWVTNCIGLSNHREFILMLVGFVAISVLGTVLDVALFCHTLVTGTYFISFDAELYEVIGIALHLMYSLIFGYYVLPIFRLHVKFVSRNELAQEWKNDEFYIVYDELTGSPVWVGDLQSEQFDDKFDLFEYDPTRNPYDKGCWSNCSSFWCTRRCSIEQKGAF